MDVNSVSHASWRRGGLCANQACVEVAAAGNEVYLRDGKDPEGGMLRFTRSEWEAFLGSAKVGDFDEL